jgi:hypothetical protein
MVKLPKSKSTNFSFDVPQTTPLRRFSQPFSPKFDEFAIPYEKTPSPLDPIGVWSPTRMYDPFRLPTPTAGPSKGKQPMRILEEEEELFFMGGGDKSADAASISRGDGLSKAQEMFPDSTVKTEDPFMEFMQKQQESVPALGPKTKSAPDLTNRKDSYGRSAYQKAAAEARASGDAISKVRSAVVKGVEKTEDIYQKGRAGVSKGIEKVGAGTKKGVEKSMEGLDKVTGGKVSPEINFVKEKLTNKIDEVTKSAADALPKKFWQKKTVYLAGTFVIGLGTSAAQVAQSGAGTNIAGELGELKNKLETFLTNVETTLENIETALNAVNKFIDEELPKLKKEFMDKLGNIETALNTIIELLGKLLTQGAGGTSTDNDGGRGV